MKIIITESQLEHLKKRSFFSKEEGDFIHEINEDGNNEPDLAEIESIVKDISKSHPEIIADLANLVFENAGYHAGTLGGKSDYLDKSYRGDMPFTGYYFIGDPFKAVKHGGRVGEANKGFKICDFSRYKLLRPGTNGYWQIKNSLKRFERALYDSENEFDSIFNKLDREFPYTLNISSRKGDIKNLWDAWIAKYDGNFTERFETGVLKLLGYEGIDVTGTKENNGSASPDSFTEGSCIFDLKPGTYLTLAEAYIKALKNRENPDLVRPMWEIIRRYKKGQDFTLVRVSGINGDWL